MTTLILPATAAHIEHLRDNLRPGERHEIACLGSTPAEALRTSLAASIFARTAILDGRIVAMWGCGGSPLGGIGEPWLLTAPEVERVPHRVVRTARAEALEMLSVFPVLRNYVADQYRQACRMLEVIGFRLGEPFPLGPERAMFREFTMERG